MLTRATAGCFAFFAALNSSRRLCSCSFGNGPFGLLRSHCGTSTCRHRPTVPLGPLALRPVLEVLMRQVEQVQAAWRRRPDTCRLAGRRQRQRESARRRCRFGDRHPSSWARSLSGRQRQRARASRKSPVAHRLAPRWLLGIEGDISWISLARTRTVPTIGPGSFAAMSATNHSLASVRGRVGFIGWSKTLYYVTGGAAWASTEIQWAHDSHYRR